MFTTGILFGVGGPGEVLQISSDGDNQRILLGLKFSILGFFWVGKFGKYLLVWLDLVESFWGIQNNLNMVVSAYPGCIVLQIKYRDQTCF